MGVVDERLHLRHHDGADGLLGAGRPGRIGEPLQQQLRAVRRGRTLLRDKLPRGDQVGRSKRGRQHRRTETRQEL